MHAGVVVGVGVGLDGWLWVGGWDPGAHRKSGLQEMQRTRMHMHIYVETRYGYMYVCGW